MHSCDSDDDDRHREQIETGRSVSVVQTFSTLYLFICTLIKLIGQLVKCTVDHRRTTDHHWPLDVCVCFMEPSIWWLKKIFWHSIELRILVGAIRMEANEKKENKYWQQKQKQVSNWAHLRKKSGDDRVLMVPMSYWPNKAINWCWYIECMYVVGSECVCTEDQLGWKRNSIAAEEVSSQNFFADLGKGMHYFTAG